MVDRQRKNGVSYRVTVGKQKIYEQDVSGMLLPWSEREVFSIAPVLTGAGRGVGTFLLGAALVGVAFFLLALDFHLLLEASPQQALQRQVLSVSLLQALRQQVRLLLLPETSALA